MTQHIRDIGKNHWLGELYETDVWKRCTLFHIERNDCGGSTSWPIAVIDVVDHPSQDGINPHKEITISLRNDIRRVKAGIEVDKNVSKLRHIDDIVDGAVLENSVAALKELGIVSFPYSLYICIRHIEEYRTEGEFWNDE